MPGPPTPDSWRTIVETQRIDVVAPLCDRAWPPSGEAGVGWIPDFQHHHLPELFSQNELKVRDDVFDRLRLGCERVMVSSHAVATDFARVFPAEKSKVRVLSFPSSYWTDKPSPKPESTVERYNLPRRFAFVANQFWKHKNHRVLPEALSIAGESALPIVVAGMPSDFRDPSNAVLSEFLQEIARIGVHERIRFLGRVAANELKDLLRCAAVVIQPSLCEGWSTTVEDAKAFGRPVICSDIAVHREQLGEKGIFFDPSDTESLARSLALAADFPAGPNPQTEAAALETARQRAAQFGRDLVAVASEAWTVLQRSEPSILKRLVQRIGR